jgi:hypothetical protein
MARHTGLKIHVFGVFFVTIHAAGNLPMGCVALVASHVCVGAGVFFDLNTLLLVAGEAGRCKLPLQFHIKRGMDVRVTACTLLEFIMRLPAVAHATFRYGVCALGRMLLVTVQTANLGFVFGPAVPYG